MSKETDLALFGDDERKPKRHILDTVNDRLRVNNTEEDELTIQGIAGKLGIDTRELYKWAESDLDFKEGLERYKTLQDVDLFKDDNLGNRADGMIIALLLLETKKRHEK
jgi:hypothetical protein